MTENEKLMQEDIDAFGMEVGDKFALMLFGFLAVALAFYGIALYLIIRGLIFLL